MTCSIDCKVHPDFGEVKSAFGMETNRNESSDDNNNVTSYCLPQIFTYIILFVHLSTNILRTHHV